MKYIFASLFLLLVTFSLSKFIFDPTNLYYELWWLDIPMHIIGGFGVACLVLAVAHHGKQRFSLIQVLMLYLCVTVAWELYEFIHDIIRSSPANGWSDTLGDTINGAIGALGAYYLFKK